MHVVVIITIFLRASLILSVYCDIQRKYCVAFARFRCSCHKLTIETGRQNNEPLNERICSFCLNQNNLYIMHFFNVLSMKIFGLVTCLIGIQMELHLVIFIHWRIHHVKTQFLEYMYLFFTCWIVLIHLY